MDLDDPFGGGGEPGGEEDLLDEAVVVATLEEIFGEEPSSPPATSLLLPAPPLLPVADEAAAALIDPDEMMLGTRPKADVLAWIQQQTKASSPPEVPAPPEAPTSLGPRPTILGPGADQSRARHRPSRGGP